MGTISSMRGNCKIKRYNYIDNCAAIEHYIEEFQWYGL